MIGGYENRIRRMSAPEKVFEYFASIQGPDGQCYMLPHDFVRAVTPFSEDQGPQEVGSKNFKYNWQAGVGNRGHTDEAGLARYAACLKAVVAAGGGDATARARVAALRAELGVTPQAHHDALRAMGVTHRAFEALLDDDDNAGMSKFFDLVDTDGDGLISYGEYVFFLTLLSIPTHDFAVAFRMFDDDGNGTIDVAVMRGRTPTGQAVRDRTLLNHDLNRVASAGAFARFFGADGAGRLEFGAFKRYVMDLKEEVWRIEFAALDVSGTGALAPLEFANYMIANAGAEHEKRLRARAAAMYADYRITSAIAETSHTGGGAPKQATADTVHYDMTQRDFINFHLFLEQLEDMKMAMAVLGGTGRGLDEAHFLRAAKAACGGRQLLSAPVVKILFALFDAARNDRLNQEEFIDVMLARRTNGQMQKRDLGVLKFLRRCKYCAKTALASDDDDDD